MTQLKSSPLDVVKSNFAKCGDTLLVTFVIGLLFFGIEVLARKIGYDQKFVAPLKSVIDGQLDVLSVAFFYAVIVFYAGSHLILKTVMLVQSVWNFVGLDRKMDVFYLFVLQYIASAVGIRGGMLCIRAISSGDPLAGTKSLVILVMAALVLVGIWCLKDMKNRAWALISGVVLIVAAVWLYFGLASSWIPGQLS